MTTAEQKANRDALRAYLRQYNNARQRRHDLDHRLREVMAELNNPPVGGQHHGGQPRPKGRTASGAASVAYKIDAVEQRIKDQQSEMTRTIGAVLDLIDLLPEASPTRSILERRYIDGQRWSEITKAEHLTRSRCAEIETEAVDELLRHDKVLEAVRPYKERNEK